MVKRIFSLILAVLLLLALDWIIYCKQCEKDLFGDNPVVSPGN
mgnify:CR=1 FL=1